MPRKILAPAKNCWEVCETRESGLLVDGRDYYLAFYHAALRARRTLLISGWQFDSTVALLRGDDAGQAGSEARLVSFLNHLCEQNPALHIYILAWNFSVIYLPDREWFQEWYINWTTNERLKFRFDQSHAFGASHHQKFVVVDGSMAFVGGLDLCSSRWDDRDHRAENPYRVNSDQRTYEPFHDIQSYHVGPAAEKLAELFKVRWHSACGEDLEIPPPETHGGLELRHALPVSSERVAISRTGTKASNGLSEACQEIRALYLDAIDAAEELIYIENQYFSSQAVYRALLDRLEAADRPRLEIVLIIAREAHGFVEQIAIEIVQAKIIHSLREVASRMGHSLGVYYPVSMGAGNCEVATYIHSKLILIDDRFLSLGSANLNNRSMGLDTELNVTWEASLNDSKGIRSIRKVRVDLLAEHTGMRRRDKLRKLGRTKKLVSYLNRVAESRSSRLRRHPLDGLSENQENQKWLSTLLPEGLPLDPEGPLFEQTVYERISAELNGLFTQGITSLSGWLQGATEPSKPEASSKERPR